MLTQQDIIDFCNQHNYDIRESHNGRWIDQKYIKARFDNGELFILLPTKPVKHEEETRYINIQ